MATKMKVPAKPGKKALPPFMGKESKKEEKMEKGKFPAFKAGGKVKKGC